MASSIQIVASVENEASGPSYSVPRLCDSLSALGHRTRLAALAPGGGKSTTAPDQDLFAHGMGPRKLGCSPQMAGWLRAAANDVDVIHSHGLWMMPNVYAGRAAARAKRPLIVSPRGTLSDFAFGSGSRLKPAFWRFLQRPSLRQAMCFHATGWPEFEDIRRRGFTQPVAVIPNGIDLPAHSERQARRDGPRRLLYFGRLHPEKGLEALLQTWARVSPDCPDWHLHLVGPDPKGFRARLKASATALGLRRIAFGPPVYGAAKTALYDGADICILPSPSENFGMTVAEALACGVPVLTTTGTPWWTLPSKGAGWCVPPDVDSLTAGLRIAMATPSPALLRMGEAGRRWMASDYTWPQTAAQMNAVYQWLLGGRAKPDCVCLS